MSEKNPKQLKKKIKQNLTAVGTPADKIVLNPELEFHPENAQIPFSKFTKILSEIDNKVNEDFENAIGATKYREAYDKTGRYSPRPKTDEEGKLRTSSFIKKLKYWIARNKQSFLNNNVWNEEFSTTLHEPEDHSEISFIHPETSGIKRGIHLGSTHMNGKMYYKVGVLPEQKTYLVKPTNVLTINKKNK